MVLIRRIISQTDPLGRVTSFAFDGFDRPTRIAGPEALTVEGQLTQAVQDGVATVFDYDGLARPSAVAAGSRGVSYRSS